MSGPIKILLQTTIPFTADDWHIGRFSLLRDHLSEVTDENGDPLFSVTVRDRSAFGSPDPVLSAIDGSDFDELWLFAVDTGDGLTPEDCAAISRFRGLGRGLLVARDHMDLGSSVCTLGGVGKAHFFHSRNQEPDEARHMADDRQTPEILWPNYHSGSNGDYQLINMVEPKHVLLHDPGRTDGIIRYLPAHPHEGAVGAPEDNPSARVIATGTSKASGREFNLVVAFDPSSEAGPAIAQSTFHHFCDYNWDPRMGSPSFVKEPVGEGLAQSADAQRSIRQYALNAALWLAGRSPVGRCVLCEPTAVIA
jgi:hypothetical protein